MKDLKIPVALKTVLKEHGIDTNEVLITAETDMNVEGAFADGFLVLTTKNLYLFQGAPNQKRIRYFKGYSELSGQSPEEIIDLAMKVYRTDELSGLHIEHQISCSLLVGKVADTDYQLAAFSNTYKKNISDLVKCFENIGSPDEWKPSEEDEDLFCPKCGHMYPEPERKVCPKCMNRKSILVRTLKYCFKYKVQIILMAICFVLSASINLVWPILTGQILYDRVLDRDNAFLANFGVKNGEYILALLLLVLAMILTKVVMMLLQILHGTCVAKVVSGVIRDVSSDIFCSMGKLSMSFFKSRQTGGLMTRVVSDVDRWASFLIDGLPYVFVHGFTIIASIIVMMKINWKMALITLVLIPILIALGMYLRPRIWVLYGKRHRAERAVNSQVNDNLTGARVVKSFGQEKLEMERFHNVNSRLRETEIRISAQQNILNLAYGAAQEVASIAIWIIGVYLILGKKSMEIGTLITFAGYIAQLNWPLKFFSRVFYWWTDSMNCAQRMFEIIDAVPDIREKENPISMPNPEGEIELRSVTFGYEAKRAVLKDIDLVIPKNKMLGIVGRSGAGKTTLVNLISRMYDPQEGSIFIDGVDIKDLAFHDLRRNVAMVSQETFIFMGTVAENIAYAKPDATLDEIMLSAKLASAHDFIMRMPDGYDTKIGVSGRTLSGGERQRISIARAILANPKILILDEATASVDTETEQAIQKSIDYLIQGRTTISIAHRLSTLRDADYLVVIEDGRITERGTAEELEKLHGTYYKLMELQTKALALKNID